jgi:hypothetical protein
MLQDPPVPSPKGVEGDTCRISLPLSHRYFVTDAQPVYFFLRSLFLRHIGLKGDRGAHFHTLRRYAVVAFALAILTEFLSEVGPLRFAVLAEHVLNILLWLHYLCIGA